MRSYHSASADGNNPKPQGRHTSSLPELKSNSPTPAAHDHVKKEEQHDRADEGRKNGAGEAAEGRVHAELPKDPTADEGAHDADDDVTDQPNTANHQRGKYTCNQPDNQPRYEIHCARFLWK